MEKVPAFGKEMRTAFFLLDQQAALTNHGSFGAVPKAVHQTHMALLRQVERHPDSWFRRDVDPLYRQAVKTLAEFVVAPVCDVVLVDNVTTAVSTVLRGISLGKGAGLLITSLTYPACRYAAEVACREKGARLHSLDIGLPVSSPEAVIDLYQCYLDAHTDIQFALVDHITSPSAIVMPVKHIISLCHTRGVRVMVDGAHAPGQLDLNITELQPDYYTCNLHKWLYCPRSCALLYVRPELQEGLKPLVVSHWYYRGFQESFTMQGTIDYTPYCMATQAVAFFKSIGGLQTVSLYSQPLVEWATGHLCQRWDSHPLPVPKEMRAPCMSLISLPECLGPATQQRIDELMTELHSEFNVQTVVDIVDGKLWCRISAQVYNYREEYERLAEAMATIITRAQSQEP